MRYEVLEPVGARVTDLSMSEVAPETVDELIRHPVSGRTALYVSTPQRCVSISCLPAVEAEETIRFLLDHSTRADNTLRHGWSPGDVVMWDNTCVLHRADHGGVVGDRVMHRGMARGYASSGLASA